MKRSSKIFMAVMVIGISISCASCVMCFNQMMGCGDLVTLEKNVSKFEKINSVSCAEIRFHASDEYRAVVTIDANIYGYVEVFTKNNVLTIRTERGQNISPTKLLVDVYCPFLSCVTMTGAGRFIAMDDIIAPSFDVIISGSGKVEGAVDCNRFSAKISGSGKVAMDGSAKDANIIISGSGNFNGSDLCIKNAAVNISGSGNANVFVTDHLKAIISGSGRINYRGEPKVTSTVSGSGRIRKM